MHEKIAEKNVNKAPRKSCEIELIGWVLYKKMLANRLENTWRIIAATQVVQKRHPEARNPVKIMEVQLLR